MAAIRHAEPENTSTALSDTSILRAPWGKQYAPNILATNAPPKARACARKNVSVTSAVWNSRGKNGKMPPHVEVAFTVRKQA